MDWRERLYENLIEDKNKPMGFAKKAALISLIVGGGAFGGAKVLKTTTPTPVPAPGISIEKAGDALDKPMFSQEQGGRVDQALERARRSRELRARIKGKGK